MGEYRNGEEQRKNLFYTSRDLGDSWKVYHFIKAGLASSRGERRAFEAEWSAKAFLEMEENPDWEMWEDIQEMLDGPSIEAQRRIVSTNDADYFNPADPEEFLGPRCYVRTSR